jgi:hypothetical protein
MKTKILFSIGVAVALCGWQALAADDFGEDHSSSTNCWGGDSLHEDFDQEVLLLPTTNAPAGAGGKAELEASSDGSTNGASIQVEISGLSAGIYHVGIVDVTGTNALHLGDITIGSNSGENDDDSIENNPEADGEEVENTFALPPDFDPTTLASLLVYDTNDMVLLTGDFTSLTNTLKMSHQETVAVVPVSATQAQGDGTVSLTYKKGKTKGTFRLNVSGLPAKQKVSILADGVVCGSAQVNARGVTKVQKLRGVNLADLQTVEAKDINGNTLFRLDF